MADWDEPQNPTPARADSSAYSAEISRLRSELEAVKREAVDVVEWYGENARLCRLIHSEGDSGRNALAEDGGKRARAFVEKHGRDG